MAFDAQPQIGGGKRSAFPGVARLHLGTRSFLLRLNLCYFWA
jgi:hypothetical protein